MMTFSSPFDTLIPRPVSARPEAGSFAILPTSKIYFDPDTPALRAVGEYLAGLLGPATGFPLPVLRAGEAPEPGSFNLTSHGAAADLGSEGYRLEVTPQAVTIAALQPAGAFYAVQTLRQLLPPAVESSTHQTAPWLMPCGTIQDKPRFVWRGMMLDVARHFFGVAEIERLLDLAAFYKLNRFHLHLTDDQGWRLEIKSWPELARKGASSAVGGDPGGFYTQAQYAGLVAYAARRFITLVPEIEMPSHINAALACYPELNCDGLAPDLYTGTEVGFSSLCSDKEITYRFVDEVLGEVAALTPGAYLHIGGDEAHSTPADEYQRFIERLQGIVEAHGKTMVGWEEIGAAQLRPGVVAQAWKGAQAVEAVRKGGKAILSPAHGTYLDMKYDDACPLGLAWAGTVEVEDSYAWDPAEVLDGLVESDILGVEAALWTETVRSRADIDYLTFPRLPGLAEIAWSAAERRSWEEYRLRLAAHAPRLEALGIGFYRSPQVPW